MLKKILSIFLIILGIAVIFSGSAKAATIDAPHWQKSPIDVYIPEDTRQGAMRRAFERWQNNSFGKLKFNFVEHGPADIDVVFTDKVDGSDSPIASYNVTIQGMKIVKAEIQIATQGSEIKKYSKNYIFTTMLHEVGHALGMQHNARKKSSIMYTPVNETQELMQIDIRALYYLNGWSYMDRRISD